MPAVQIPGESTRCSGNWSEAWNEARNLTPIILKLWKVLAQELLFFKDHRHIDDDKDQEDRSRNQPILSGPTEASGENERTEIQRISRVSIGTGSSEFLVFPYVAGSESADQ